MVTGFSDAEVKKVSALALGCFDFVDIFWPVSIAFYFKDLSPSFA